MYEELVQRIKEHVLSKQHGTIEFGPATPQAIEKAERELGFPIPDILKMIYQHVGNGGFGPEGGGEIIGVEGGYATSAGTLVAAYNDMRRGAEYGGFTWKDGLLPFCFWGCTKYTAVDCLDTRLSVYQVDACEAEPEGHGLVEFVEEWLKDVCILDRDESPREEREITNPFTRKKIVVRGSKKKKQ